MEKKSQKSFWGWAVCYNRLATVNGMENDESLGWFCEKMFGVTY